MTHIYFDTNKMTFHLKVTGHADYNPGNDIVCSACSILAQTCAESVLRAQPKCDGVACGDGICEITVTARDYSERKKLATIFDTVINGYRLLQSGYPKNVALHTS